MPTTTKPTIERKIRFYRAQAGTTGTKEPVAFDAAKVFAHIDTLPWVADGRYRDEGKGIVSCCWVHEKHVRRVWFAAIRRSDLPQVEQGGKLRALGVPTGAGLAERTHMVFFPDNIVGVEFNFYAPRISRLRYYLAEKAPTLAPRVTFDALLRNDAAERLADLKDIRMLDLRIRPSLLATIKETNDSLGSAFGALISAGKAEDVEIVLRTAPRSKSALSHPLLTACKRILRDKDFRNEASTFRVKGYSNELKRVEIVDLLSDALISKKAVVREGANTKAVDSTSAFMAIEEAYKDHREELLAATSIGPDED
jgi:hypothetical protein